MPRMTSPFPGKRNSGNKNHDITSGPPIPHATLGTPYPPGTSSPTRAAMHSHAQVIHKSSTSHVQVLRHNRRKPTANLPPHALTGVFLKIFAEIFPEILVTFAIIYITPAASYSVVVESVRGQIEKRSGER